MPPSLQLTPHFTLDEFQPDTPMPADCIYPYTRLAELILEPLRQQFNEPIVITSGYRAPASNCQAHGVSNSQHIATANYCAADFFLPSMQQDMRPLFDYCRYSQLPFDQLILEHGEHGDIVHVSWAKLLMRRMALEGETANKSAYAKWDSAAVDA